MSPTEGSSGGGRSTCLSFQRSQSRSFLGLGERSLQREDLSLPLPRSRSRSRSLHRSRSLERDRERRLLFLSLSLSLSRSLSRWRLLSLLLLRLRLLRRLFWLLLKREADSLSITPPHLDSPGDLWLRDTVGPALAVFGVCPADTGQKHLQLFHGVGRYFHIIFVQTFLRQKAVQHLAPSGVGSLVWRRSAQRKRSTYVRRWIIRTTQSRKHLLQPLLFRLGLD